MNNHWKPVTTPAEPNAYAPNQVPYELTDAEKSKAAIYSLDLERNRRRQNQRDTERRKFRSLPTDPDAAA